MQQEHVTLLRQSHAALLKAYPDEHSLRLMVGLQLDQDLDSITPPEPLPSRIFALLRWAEAQGRLAELITRVVDDRPGNVDVQNLRKLIPGMRGAPGAVRVNTLRLPPRGKHLFGRSEDLAVLDRAAQDGTAIVVIVAFGGTGKSTLVSHWLRALQRNNYGGFARVFGWSFINQGLASDSASADLFVDTTLKWFGQIDPAEGTPLDRGFALAECIREDRTLLILDGLEALQYWRGRREGQLRDEKMYALLRALAEQNYGLCVITSRTWPEDLSEFEGTSVKRLSLEQLSVRAGIETLRAYGVTGEDDELEAVVQKAGGNTFYLRSLATYVRSHGGDVHAWKEGDYSGEEREPLHDLMRGYAEWFSGGPELATLYLVSLFEGPCDMDLLETLRAAPAIEDLTDSLQTLNLAGWRRVVTVLQDAGMILAGAARDEVEPHPLVREYFGERLRVEHPQAWRKAHGRLSEHFKLSTAALPATIEEMWPLFLAVRHACHAGRYVEALNDVYWRRISRGTEQFHVKQLGAVDAALACLAHFFDSKWKTPVAVFSDSDVRFLLAEAAFLLEGVGRLTDALEPAQEGLRLAIEQNDIPNAALGYYNVGGLCRMMGDLEKAHEHARGGVDIAASTTDGRWSVITLASEAATRHQMGAMDEARRLFERAEELTRSLPHESVATYYVLRYWMFELLLEQGALEEVIERSREGLERGSGAGAPPLAFGLDRLSLARAHAARARENGDANLEEAARLLDLALDDIRRSGRQTYLPAGLRARGELRLETGDFAGAETDLRRALALAKRSRMRLEEADCHLAMCRLELARNDPSAARASLEPTIAIVADCGYHRRDAALRELTDRL